MALGNLMRIACAPAALAVLLTATYTGGRAPGSPGGEPITLVVPAAVIAALPFVWVRARPRPVLAVLLAELAGSAVIGLRWEQVWPLLLTAGLVLMYVTAVRDRRDGFTAMVFTLLAEEASWLTGLVTSGGWGQLLVPGLAGLGVLLALSVLAAWLAGTSVRQQREYDESVRRHQAARAVTDERLRIARDLHDMVAHSIGVIAIQAGAGHRVIRVSPQQAEGALRAIEDTSRHTLRDLREMLGILRRADTGPQPDTGTGSGPQEVARTDAFAGLDDLDRLTATTRAAGVEVDVRRQGVPDRLPPTIDHAAFRIVQESVTNVVRTPTPATAAWRSSTARTRSTSRSPTTGAAAPRARARTVTASAACGNVWPCWTGGSVPDRGPRAGSG
ncbi:histidine kinase [Streptomyces sp. RY43-2]|uniref:histidine kinase n=1 Tax=Streptomyces macrolidinus TaxID=2952607 RepID=A0ABT0ZLI5_9ACTN|nr:histidine kinase [Streptomyces macrolidinus]MCN9244416.1 histidine kinase [Streptomyces macrolidinus]